MPFSKVETSAHSNQDNNEAESHEARPKASSYTSQMRDWSDDDIPRTHIMDKGKNIALSNNEDEEYHPESSASGAP